MNIQKLLPLFFAALVVSSAEAAVNTDNLSVYSFQRTEAATLDASKSYMKQFLPYEYSDRLAIPETNIVRYVSARDPNTTFEHNVATGDLSFNRNFSRYLGSFVPKLPTTDSALKYANLFLEQNKLLPANPEELKVAHVGGLRSTSILSTGRAGPVVDKLVTITYSRELNGVPVIGTGSKLVVNIGDSGEVIGVTRRWRELDKPVRLSSSEILSEKEALELSNRQILSEFGEKSRVEVLQTQIAYFDNNGETLQPVFAFQTKIQLADQKLPTVEYISVIPAMRKPIENLNLTQADPTAFKLIQSGSSTIPGESDRTSD
ncbi:MAG: hypothetical protein EOO52_14095 [Gammaproteobacteria bacterium]|nr:MAG: hypothetical protein EOO52_14095 [Gammaproteobacteria bacterium]